jgi:2-octaprenyl-6-methoxyphenol hydroxylase
MITDVAIVGGGPVGLTLALGLARRGLQISLFDPAASVTSGRWVLVSYGCWRIWRSLGLEPQIRPLAEPVLSIAASGTSPDSGAAFSSDDAPDGGPLGFMIDSGALCEVLGSACSREPLVRIGTATIDSLERHGPAVRLHGTAGAVEARLAVGCDGLGSRVRQWAGIRFEGWRYSSRALSTTVTLKEPHNSAARQVFLPSGPVAVLPLPGGSRANIVWTLPSRECEAMARVPDEVFADLFLRRTGGVFGPVLPDGQRRTFSLGLHVCDRFHSERVALAGDSAHQVHPLAGQGLNLGLKDAAALCDVVGDAAGLGLDIGSASVLSDYDRWRRADVVAAAAAMQGFATVFGAPAPVRALASTAMRMTAGFPAARRLIAREAGSDLGELPSLMRA